MILRSSGFAEGELIAWRYSSPAQNELPPLEIAGVPEDSRSLALVFENVDSPVIDALISRGSRHTLRRQRVIWGITQGAVAATLLIVGGEMALSSIQTASIAVGLPVMLILVLACVNLVRALRREYRVEGVEPPWQ